jgi:hypothetical protein
MRTVRNWAGNQATLRSRYPEWDDVAAMRARLDPDGPFRNGELDRVLGPIPT